MFVRVSREDHGTLFERLGSKLAAKSIYATCSRPTCAQAERGQRRALDALAADRAHFGGAVEWVSMAIQFSES